MDFIRTYQSGVMNILMGICISIIFFTHILKFQNPKIKRTLYMLELSVTMVLVADRFAYLTRGDTSTFGYWMVRISNFAVFWGLCASVGYFGLFVKNMILDINEDVVVPRRLKVSIALSGIGRILVVISQFTGLYYTFTEDNYYQRAPGFIISYILFFLIYGLLLSVIIQFYTKFPKLIRKSFIIFEIAPLVAAIIQYFNYGISLNTLFLVIALIVLFAFVLIEMNNSVDAAKQREHDMENEYHDNTEKLFLQTVEVLSGAIDAKDKYTQGHSLRVAQYSKKLAKMIGLSKEDQQKIFYAGLLHDVGKIGIDESILNKEGKLTNEEFAEIKKHPVIGGDILSKVTLLPYLSEGARYHHERYDGMGYPMGLKGTDIPLIARIISVADAYDAMSSRRSYRDVIPQQHVREQIVMGMGTQFDPEIAEQMIHLIDMDFEYKMKEHLEGNGGGRKSFKFVDYLGDFSEGLLIISKPVKVKIRFSVYDKTRNIYSMPSLIVYDSLDEKIHTEPNKAAEMHFVEFFTVRADGMLHEGELRNTRITPDPDITIDAQKFAEAANEGMEIEYELARMKDHLRVRMKNSFQTVEYIVALQDSIKYSYAALTGENCDVDIISIENSNQPIAENDIPRIAEEISYITGPEGDIPNFQSESWRVNTSKSVKIDSSVKLQMFFHALSLPTARLVWHCPSIVIFSSDDGTVDGSDYKEYALLRMDGENKGENFAAQNSSFENKNLTFENWGKWKEKNKSGVDCTVSFERDGNKIITRTENAGLEMVNTTVLPVEDSDKIVYAALTGDQVAISNIRVKKMVLWNGIRQ